MLLAGGVGLTPMMSMIRTAAHRGDPRAYRLIVVAGAPTDLLFRDELAELRSYIDLEVTEVLRRPDAGWPGPTGGITVGLLSMVLGTVELPGDLDYFICGPPAMVTDAMEVLDSLGVAPGPRAHRTVRLRVIRKASMLRRIPRFLRRAATPPIWSAPVTDFRTSSR